MRTHTLHHASADAPHLLQKPLGTTLDLLQCICRCCSITVAAMICWAVLLARAICYSTLTLVAALLVCLLSLFSVLVLAGQALGGNGRQGKEGKESPAGRQKEQKGTCTYVQTDRLLYLPYNTAFQKSVYLVGVQLKCIHRRWVGI